MRNLIVLIAFVVLSVSGALLTVSAVRSMQVAQMAADKSLAEALQ